MKIKKLEKVPLIICVGRNYRKHAEEMNSSIENDPVIFFKPSTSFINKDIIPIPLSLGILHYEVELTVLMKSGGRCINKTSANDHIWGYGIGIDFTLRELQNKFKERRLPWELSKGFDNSAYISEFIEKSNIPDIGNIDIKLYKNGNLVQNSNTNEMIFSIERIIEHTSKFISIKNKYLIMTGTPSGVGPVQDGDMLKMELGDILERTVHIKRK
ncbi:fumarylacetoacetate hydrolase family protein [bacterium]|nr:fumarylacetoacetate hydrolase family protein [bacterium]